MESEVMKVVYRNIERMEIREAISELKTLQDTFDVLLESLGAYNEGE